MESKGTTSMGCTGIAAPEERPGQYPNRGWYTVTLSEWGGETFEEHVNARDEQSAMDCAARVARKEGRPAACAISAVRETTEALYQS